ncbi:hypothetical protein SISNIDRAFT_389579, partial [Sistotremastrum niveocremeum HHB9708]
MRTLTTVQNLALRFICAGFRTTPIYALELEASILPIKHHLDELSHGAAIRITTLPKSHPITLRLTDERRRHQGCADMAFLGPPGTNTTGAGVVGYHRDEEIFSIKLNTGTHSEVFDAELSGLARASEQALRYAGSHPEIQYIHLYADNISALQIIHQGLP